MPRRARLIVTGIPHHITQRGNRRQPVFFNDDDRIFYLNSLAEQCRRHEASIIAYCLMTNHVHHTLVPATADGLHRALKAVHTKYAYRINRRFDWTGHLWQCRYFSTPLDNETLKVVVRYIESNPVRAGIVREAEDYPWSSAASRVYQAENPWLDTFHAYTNVIPSGSHWKDYLQIEDEGAGQKIKKLHEQNLPYGAKDFIRRLEAETGRFLRYRKQGGQAKGDRPL